jgi:hypothetical protein
MYRGFRFVYAGWWMDMLIGFSFCSESVWEDLDKCSLIMKLSNSVWHI